MIGLYLHVPFCGKKCPYCDFYSGAASVSSMDAYTAKMIQTLESYRGKNLTAETLYFGGGTPNLLGAERLTNLIKTAREVFSIAEDSEITVECNPATVDFSFLEAIRNAGANRLSLGVQSAIPEELKLLGRRHTPEQAAKVVEEAKRAGFTNISLDLMVGIPGQTEESLIQSIDWYASLDVPHISSYLLKVEPGTEFYARKDALSLPDDDTMGDWYLTMVRELESRGFAQYEISNFSRPGYEGRHNLKYWRCEEYLGLGPAAHSFFEGKRSYNKPSLDAFLSGAEPTPDGDGGSREEFAMLCLRLTEGLSDAIWQSRFGEDLPESLLKSARRYAKVGLIAFTGERSFRFTPEGFLVSNALLCELMEELD